MSRSNNYHGSKRNWRNKPKAKLGEKGREVIEQISDSHPVIQQFRAYSQELDDKNDRFERIVKHSRDITIESKRVIFLLHTLNNENKKKIVLAEAKLKLDKICERYFRNVASELENHDIYQYLRAYRGGLQEFVEAYTFYWYLDEGTLSHWNKLQDILTFVINENSKNVESKNEDEAVKEKAEQDVTSMRTIKAIVIPSEFIMGIADLTGELMRRCINSLSIADLNTCYNTCAFVKEIYKYFLGCSGKVDKEFNRKLITLKWSILKMEYVCYTIKVRGSELPQHMLAGVLDNHQNYAVNEEDEGYNAY